MASISGCGPLIPGLEQAVSVFNPEGVCEETPEQQWLNFSQRITQGVQDSFPMEVIFKQASEACGVHLQFINTGVVRLKSFNLAKLVEAFHRLDPHVENGASLTYVAMRKGLNFVELLEKARDKKIIVKFDLDVDKLLKKVGDVFVKEDYGVLIANDVLKNSPAKLYADQKELVSGLGCRMPTFLEHFTRFVYAGGGKVYEEKPQTFMFSSTCIGKRPVALSCSLVINESGFISRQILANTPQDNCAKHNGAGGCQEI
jgi:predicted transport protein